ncbi:hypothetical protein [Burkholderia ubonensis]|uniref:hypothetical protein n=1 Tax=Burkholderia ubonensis TaxID=101571 RepID=UPI0015828E3A|nr:hypothetical protein [Burkholderia ubonensis]
MVSINEFNECDARRAHRRVNEPGRAATRTARPDLQPPCIEPPPDALRALLSR